MYPVQEFVVKMMKAGAMKKVDLVRAMGYRNIAKGIRRLDSFLEGRDLPRQIIDNLHTALGVPEEEIISRLTETRDIIQKGVDEELRMQDESARKRFVPYLFCATKRKVPGRIFMCAITGASCSRYAYLHYHYEKLSPEEQAMNRMEVIAFKLQQHEGSIPPFGKITHFVLKRTYDDIESRREVYNLEGNMITNPSAEMQEIHRGRAELTHKGKNLLPLFRKYIKKN